MSLASKVRAKLARKIPTHDHPAVFSPQLYGPLIEAIADADLAVDVFSGTGLVHELAAAAGVATSIGVELEPEWANLDLFGSLPRLQMIGDSRLVVPTLAGHIARVARGRLVWITSPTYGSRMGDHHDAKDPCRTCLGESALVVGCKKCRGTGLTRRNTYRHRLRRPLSPGSSAGMQWGPAYRELHEAVWSACAAQSRPGDRFVLNIKDHIRKHETMPVTAWHAETLQRFGFTLVRRTDVACPGNRQGTNGPARVPFESVLVFEFAGPT
jgi:hypothetical protein